MDSFKGHPDRDFEAVCFVDRHGMMMDEAVPVGHYPVAPGGNFRPSSCRHRYLDPLSGFLNRHMCRRDELVRVPPRRLEEGFQDSVQ